MNWQGHPLNQSIIFALLNFRPVQRIQCGRGRNILERSQHSRREYCWQRRNQTSVSCNFFFHFICIILNLIFIFLEFGMKVYVSNYKLINCHQVVSIQQKNCCNWNVLKQSKSQNLDCIGWLLVFSNWFSTSLNLQSNYEKRKSLKITLDEFFKVRNKGNLS